MPQYTRAISGGMNPYAAEALVVDTTPAVQYALQQEAKKQAAQDAIDKHNLDLGNIDTKGIRPIDQEGLMGKVNGIRQFYINNQEALRNPTKDNGKTMLAYRRLIDDAKNDIGLSISTKERQKELVGKSLGKDLTSGQLDILSNLERSIYDDKHYKDPYTRKQYGVEDYGAFQTPYKNDEFVKDIIGSNIRNEEKREGKPIIEPITGQVSYNTKASYSPQVYNNILQTASVLSKTPKYQNFFENEIYKTGKLEEAEKQFQNYFGRPMQPHTEDVAKAWALLNVPQHKLGTEKIGEDWMSRLRFQHNLALEGKDDDRKWALEYIGKHLPNPTMGYTLQNNKPTGLVTDQLIIKSLAKDGKEPDKVFYNYETQKIEPVFYKRTKNINKNGTTITEIEKNTDGTPVIDTDLSLPQQIEQVLPNFINVAPKSKYAIGEIKSSMAKPLTKEKDVTKQTEQKQGKKQIKGF